jgi:hypothetical protein
MASDEGASARGFDELIARYEKWREVYSRLGRPARDQTAWENGRLNLRSGYPYPDWTGYVVEHVEDGFQVLAVTAERRNEPLETLLAFFTDIDDAGKYIIVNIGDDLRISCRLDPIEWAWDDAGLDPRVEQTSMAEYVSKFALKDDPGRYFILQAGGVQPENRLLPLTYDDVEQLLLDGIPGAETAG